MTNGITGSMRHRITLMAEVTTQGAGGRMIPTSPIIADVWASMSEPSSTKTQRGDRQFLGDAVAFETWFQPEYTATRLIEFGANRYKVQSVSKKGQVTPTIEFQTVSI